MWVFGFWQQCGYSIHASGMWLCVDEHLVSSVTRKDSVLIFRFEVSKKSSLHNFKTLGTKYPVIQLCILEEWVYYLRLILGLMYIYITYAYKQHTCNFGLRMEHVLAENDIQSLWTAVRFGVLRALTVIRIVSCGMFVYVV